MSEIKLLPCPFCGGEAELIGHYIKGVANNYQFFARCKTCEARPQRFNTFKKPEKAIEVWNTRKPLDRIVERLEEEAEECWKYWQKFDDEDSYGGMNAYKNAILIIKEGLK